MMDDNAIGAGTQATEQESEVALLVVIGHCRLGNFVKEFARRAFVMIGWLDFGGDLGMMTAKAAAIAS